jgi:hypothetical protein
MEITNILGPRYQFSADFYIKNLPKLIGGEFTKFSIKSKALYAQYSNGQKEYIGHVI